MSSRRFSFVQLDVFTSRALEGNQLAVFGDARGLSDEEMQRLARETNLSETTFIFPREPEVERREGHKVRIFTVQEELPFAGHPTLGTAWHLRRTHGGDEIVLDLKVGKIPVRFEQRDGLLFGEMRQAEPKFGPTHFHEAVARAIGVNTSALDESLPIQTVSTGFPFTMVPFRSLQTLKNLAVSWPQIAAYMAAHRGLRLPVYGQPRDGERRGHTARAHDSSTTARIRRPARPQVAAPPGRCGTACWRQASRG